MEKTKKSFTLIELLVVLVIIGILVTALVPKLNQVYSRARDMQRKADIKQIASAISVYKVDNGGVSGLALYWRTKDLTSILVFSWNYLTSMPLDPKKDWSRAWVTYGWQNVLTTGGSYGFAVFIAGSNLDVFAIMARVENIRASNRVYNMITTNGRIAAWMNTVNFVPGCESVNWTGGVALNTLGGACFAPTTASSGDYGLRYMYVQ